jgi:hypothetical protein
MVVGERVWLSFKEWVVLGESMRSLNVWDSSLTAWGEVGVWRLDM